MKTREPACVIGTHPTHNFVTIAFRFIGEPVLVVVRVVGELITEVVVIVLTVHTSIPFSVFGA